MTMGLDATAAAVPVNQAMAVVTEDDEVFVDVRSAEAAGNDVMNCEDRTVRDAAGPAAEILAAQYLLLALAVEHGENMAIRGQIALVSDQWDEK